MRGTATEMACVECKVGIATTTGNICEDCATQQPAAEATARPWIVHVTDGGAVYISDDHDFSKASFAIRADGEEVRAERIVRAVNNFDALREALRDELEALRVWLSNENNADADVREGMLISQSKLAAALAASE